MRLRFRYRRHRIWQALSLYFMRSPRPSVDLEVQEIARIEALIGRLEIAAAIGSLSAGGRLENMVELGQAQRDLAREALDRLRSRTLVGAQRI